MFTGSTRVAEHLTKVMNGKVRLEDGGYDWKVLGPDVPKTQAEIDYVAWQSDQDAYAHTGQKCLCTGIGAKLIYLRKWQHRQQREA